MSFGLVRLERGMQPHADLDAAKELLGRMGHTCDPLGLGFGLQTEQAVKTFQRSEGLRASGVVEKPTWEALIAAGERFASHVTEELEERAEEAPEEVESSP